LLPTYVLGDGMSLLG